MRALLVAALVFYFLCPAGSAQAGTRSSTVRIDKDLSAGFVFPYYLLTPDEIVENKEKRRYTILVVPNNTGKVNDDIAIHEADVRKRTAQAGAIASLLKVVVLMPVFPRPASEWKIYTHALDRDSMLTDKRGYRRLDLQLIAMIDDARRRMAQEGIRTDQRVLINGFSAQGMFANRFTFLHPDRVKAAAIGSPGGWPIAPVASFNGKALRYPIGIADLNLVSGKKLDLGALRKVPLFVFMGELDTNDSVPFDDSYDQEDRDLIYPLFGKKPVDRWQTAKQLYEQAGLAATFKLYPSVQHTVTPLMRDDIRAFLEKYAK
jgi:dienelactone hydrolase